jgi:hypothetical protein
MGWMDLSEYVLIEGAARDRLLDLLPAVVSATSELGGSSDVDAPTSSTWRPRSGSSHVPSIVTPTTSAIGSCTNDSGERAGDRSCRLPERPMRRAQSGTDRELLHVAFPPVS